MSLLDYLSFLGSLIWYPIDQCNFNIKKKFIAVFVAKLVFFCLRVSVFADKFDQPCLSFLFCIVLMKFPANVKWVWNERQCTANLTTRYASSTNYSISNWIYLRFHWSIWHHLKCWFCSNKGRHVGNFSNEDGNSFEFNMIIILEECAEGNCHSPILNPLSSSNIGTFFLTTLVLTDYLFPVQFGL